MFVTPLIKGAYPLPGLDIAEAVGGALGLT